MYSKSTGDVAKLIIMQAGIGFIIAIISWVILAVYLKVLPNENYVLYIMAVPIILMYVGFAYVTKFGNVQYVNGVLTIKPVIGEASRFSAADYDFDVHIQYYNARLKYVRLNEFAHGMEISISKKNGELVKKFRVYGYSRDTIDEIKNDLNKNG